MGAFWGEKPCRLYRGDYRPARLLLGEKQIAGWRTETFSGQTLAIDGTFRDRAEHWRVEGAGKQYSGTIRTPNPDCLVPEGYRQVTYLESTGTQYINSGVLPDTHTGVELRFQYTESPSTNPMAGCRESRTLGGYYLPYWYNTDIVRFGFFGRTTVAKNMYVLYKKRYDTNPIHIARLNLDDTGLASMDGIALDTQAPIAEASDTHFYLFGVNRGRESVFLPGRIYEATILRSNTLLRHFVPCIRRSDNAAGMYDLVYGVFYENAGTGAFLTGAEVPRTLESPVPSAEHPQPIHPLTGQVICGSRTVPVPTLYGLPNGIRDALEVSRDRAWITRRVGILESYAGEPVPEGWVSDTGALTPGAKVLIPLENPTEEELPYADYVLDTEPRHTNIRLVPDPEAPASTLTITVRIADF